MREPTLRVQELQAVLDGELSQCRQRLQVPDEGRCEVNPHKPLSLRKTRRGMRVALRHGLTVEEAANSLKRVATAVASCLDPISQETFLPRWLDAIEKVRVEMEGGGK